MPLGSTFRAQLTVTLKDKKWNETMALEKNFIEDLKKYVKDPKNNPGSYFQARNFNFRVSTPMIDNKERKKGLDEREAFYITPQLKNYDTIVDLMRAIKEWVKVHDEEVYGKRVSVTVTVRGLGDIHLIDGVYGANKVRLATMKYPEKLRKMIDALNHDIDGLE